MHFSRDVIFNEDLSGRLGITKQLSFSPPSTDLSTTSTRPVREHNLTAARHAYDKVLRLKESQGLECAKRKSARDVDIAQNGGGEVTAAGGAVLCTVEDVVTAGNSDLTPSEEVFSDLLSFLAPSNFPDQIDTESFGLQETDIISQHCLYAPLSSSSSIPSQRFPMSYAEAIA